MFMIKGATRAAKQSTPVPSFPSSPLPRHRQSQVVAKTAAAGLSLSLLVVKEVGASTRLEHGSKVSASRSGVTESGFGPPMAGYGAPTSGRDATRGRDMWGRRRLHWLAMEMAGSGTPWPDPSFS